MVKCKECGKECKNENGLRLHMRAKHDGELNSRQQAGVARKKEIPQNCRFLNPHVPIEAQALADGYSYVDADGNLYQ